jgi:hypothetical protein
VAVEELSTAEKRILILRGRSEGDEEQTGGEQTSLDHSKPRWFFWRDGA